MVCSSSSSCRVLAALLFISAPGCWTGRLIESGRLGESVVRYTSAALTGEELHLDYTVEVSDARNQPRSREERSVALALASWAARPDQPVDELAIRRVSAGSRTGREVPIALMMGPRGVPPAGRSRPLGPTLEVDERNGRHVGFRLCSTAGAQCQPYFHSAALYRDHLAWWVYPIAPLTIGVDIALLPLQVATLPIVLVLSD